MAIFVFGGGFARLYRIKLTHRRRSGALQRKRNGKPYTHESFFYSKKPALHLVKGGMLKKPFDDEEYIVAGEVDVSRIVFRIRRAEVSIFGTDTEFAA